MLEDEISNVGLVILVGVAWFTPLGRTIIAGSIVLGLLWLVGYAVWYAVFGVVWVVSAVFNGIVKWVAEGGLG